VGIGTNSGPLLASTTGPDGGSTSVNLGGATSGLGGTGLGNIDLGDLGLDGTDLGGLLPGGGGNGGDGNGATFNEVRVAFASLGSGEQQQFRIRCRAVLTSPQAFDASLVAMCRMIAKIGQTP
jgi:hypothetical protein